MTNEEIALYQKKIDELGEWYQPIEFIPGKLKSQSKYRLDSTIHGINKWNFIIRRNLPKNLRGKKILDVGCASGLYSMSCAREGAIVTGIELDEEGYRQSLLTREIFSKIDGIDYTKTMKIIKMDFMNFDWDKHGEFDLVLALNVLYWIEIPYRKIAREDRRQYSDNNLHSLIKNIKRHTKMLIVQADENKYRLRKKNKRSREATDSKRVVELLKSHGFKNISVDKPISLISLLKTLAYRIPEVDLHKPIFYARPIIKASS